MTARSLRDSRETVATLQSIIREKDYTPFQIKTMRLDWLEGRNVNCGYCE